MKYLKKQSYMFFYPVAIKNTKKIITTFDLLPEITIIGNRIRIDKKKLLENDILYSIFNLHSFTFTDLTVIDYLDRVNRFSVICLLSEVKRVFLSILETVLVFKINPVTYTASHIYYSALAAEREAYDLFGIIFKNNPDLRRILSDYSFQGFALRKDFSLSGKTSVSYSGIKKTLVYRKLILNKEFILFDYDLSWHSLI